MVKIRAIKAKDGTCESCLAKGSEVDQLYEVGIGKTKQKFKILCLCDGCMHALLQKLIKVGGNFKE